MDYQRRGACSHIMAASDPHLRCPGCRDCFLPGNPCSVCESLSAEQVALAIQARSLRLRRQARRAGSADSSSQCGPLEDKTGPPGSTPGLPVSKQGEGLTSPRSVRSRDGGRGSQSAESLSSLAGDDGDSRRNTSLGPRSQDGGSGSRLGAGSLTRGSDQLRRRRRSRTPVREHGLSRSASSDSSEASRSVAADSGPVDRPVGAADRTGRSADRTGRSADRTGRSAGRSSGSTGPAGRVVRPDRPVRPSAESDRPVEEHNPTGRSTGRSTGPAGRVVRPDADRRDFSDRRHSRREDSRDRGRSRRRRERSVSSSPSDNELERESRRERRRHGRSRHRGDRTPTPPQPSSLATGQILKAIAELKSATDAVASRVHGLERREGATHSAHSPLPPLLEEEDISLCPPRDDLMSSEEEGSRDWRPQHGDHDSLPEVLPCDRESSVATSRPSAQESVGRDEALPSGDPDARRYKDTLQNVFSFNPNMVPQDVPVDNVFGGELMALCHETQKEDRHPSFSGSGVLGSALRHTAGVLGGVAHSPLVEESAQRWGTYMSLTSPPIRQYRPEYYRVHYSADVPEAEVLQPQQLYSTSSFLAIAKGTPPTDFRIRHSLLRDWEGLQRASLGVINHLDWFLSTVWKMVGTVEVEPQMRANIDNMLTSSSVAVNHLAHVCRLDCWLAMRPSAGKDCWTPQSLTGLGRSSCAASR